MMRILFLIFFSFLCFYAVAQFNDNIWCLGDSAGIDFNSSPAPYFSGMDGRGSCVSICDSSGSLMFYGFTSTDPQILLRSKVMNRNHQLMQNGDSIYGQAWYEECLIIPFPGNTNLFYFFSIAVTSSSPYGLYYSIIDMTQNSGLGKVVSKNNQLTSLQPFEGIQAIKHGNGRDWWVVLKLSGQYNTPSNAFYVYLIDPSGISSPIIDSCGAIVNNSAGNICFSKTGNKMLLSSWNNLIEIFDFDRCTGNISNTTIIEPENPGGPGLHIGSCFSPNEEIIYLTHVYDGVTQADSWLYQYDLTAANIAASRDTLYHWIFPDVAGKLRLAPDNKIYLSTAYVCASPPTCSPYPDSIYNHTNMNLSVVNQPDIIGSACDFQPFSFFLGGKRTYYGIPNNPNYSLGPDSASVCDTLLSIFELSYSLKNAELNVFYQPVWGKLFINANGIADGKYQLLVCDVNGKNVFSETGNVRGGFYSNELTSNFSNGVYIATFQSKGKLLSRKFFIN
jgi:hypothetical protein